MAYEDHGERIARLETQIENLTNLATSLQADVQQLNRLLSRGRGILAGVALAVSVFWAGVLFMVELVKSGLHHLGKVVSS